MSDARLDCEPAGLRIMVVGASGSGKTTLARRLAAILDLPFFPTDDLYWQHGWQPTEGAAIDAWVKDLLVQARWVVDGNFDAQPVRLWRRVDRIIRLDLPLPTTIIAAGVRILQWWLTRRPVWGGNRMTFAKAVGGVGHAFGGVAVKRASYPARLAAMPPGVVTVLRSRRQVRSWLSAQASDRAEMG